MSASPPELPHDPAALRELALRQQRELAASTRKLNESTRELEALLPRQLDRARLQDPRRFPPAR